MEGVNEAQEGPDVGEAAGGQGSAVVVVVRYLVRALVADLRSGNRRQGRRYLASDMGFCCLGVACEVAIAHGLGLSKRLEEGPYHGIMYYAVRAGGPGNSRLLPAGVEEWFGFSHSNPLLHIPRELVRKYANTERSNGVRLNLIWGPERKFSATELNDDLQFTLPEIGDCFEYTFLREDWEERHGETAR